MKGGKSGTSGITDGTTISCWGGLAGAIMTGMTPEKSGKNLIRPDFPDPNGIPAGKALYSSNFSRFPGQKLCSVS